VCVCVCVRACINSPSHVSFFPSKEPKNPRQMMDDDIFLRPLCMCMRVGLEAVAPCIGGAWECPILEALLLAPGGGNKTCGCACTSLLVSALAIASQISDAIDIGNLHVSTRFVYEVKSSSHISWHFYKRFLCRPRRYRSIKGGLVHHETLFQVP